MASDEAVDSMLRLSLGESSDGRRRAGSPSTDGADLDEERRLLRKLEKRAADRRKAKLRAALRDGVSMAGEELQEQRSRKEARTKKKRRKVHPGGNASRRRQTLVRTVVRHRQRV